MSRSSSKIGIAPLFEFPVLALTVEDEVIRVNLGKDVTLCKTIKDILDAMYSPELWNFLTNMHELTVLQSQNKIDPEKLEFELAEVYRKYLATGAPDRVNVDEAVCEQIKRNLAANPLDLPCFKHAISKVCSVITGNLISGDDKEKRKKLLREARNKDHGVPKEKKEFKENAKTTNVLDEIKTYIQILNNYEKTSVTIPLASGCLAFFKKQPKNLDAIVTDMKAKLLELAGKTSLNKSEDKTKKELNKIVSVHMELLKKLEKVANPNGIVTELRNSLLEKKIRRHSSEDSFTPS